MNDSSKKALLTDSALLIAFTTATLYVCGRALSESYYLSLGIPLKLLGFRIEDMVAAGGISSLRWILFVPAFYGAFLYLRHPIAQWVGQFLKDRSSEFQQLLQFSFNAIVIIALLLSPFGFFKQFMKLGEKNAKSYLSSPVYVRYTEAASPGQNREAALLCLNAGRYFLKPVDLKNNVRFVVRNQDEISEFEVLSERSVTENSDSQKEQETQASDPR